MRLAKGTNRFGGFLVSFLFDRCVSSFPICSVFGTQGWGAGWDGGMKL